MNLTAELGGYPLFTQGQWPEHDVFGLRDSHVHAFSLGRHALRAAILSKQPQRVWLPFLTCHTVIETVKKLGVPISFYHITSDGVPDGLELAEHELGVINNYFGLTHTSLAWTNFWLYQNPMQWVIDNTQSLTCGNLFESHWSFTSPRKFISVTDGGILFTSENNPLDFSILPEIKDESWARIQWLFRAIDDCTRSASYEAYLSYRHEHVQSIPYARMSEVTSYLLRILDVKQIIAQRNMRFSLLLQRLGMTHPWAALPLNERASPIGFPVCLPNAQQVQSKLAQHKIFSIRYWPMADNKLTALNEVERAFALETLFLPLDQDYSLAHWEILTTLGCGAANV